MKKWRMKVPGRIIIKDDNNNVIILPVIYQVAALCKALVRCVNARNQSSSLLSEISAALLIVGERPEVQGKVTYQALSN